MLTVKISIIPEYSTSNPLELKTIVIPSSKLNKMNPMILIILSILFSVSVATGQTTGRNAFAASEKVKSSFGQIETTENRSVECDTLRYPLSGEIIYYYMLPPGVGYITGNNSYKDKAKAEYFASFEVGSSISGMIADFVIASSVNNPQITFAIWNNAGADGKPGAIVATTTKSLSSISSDVNSEHFTTVPFDQPYTVTGPFYAGVILPTQPGDTLALWCRKHVAGYNGTAWEQWDNGSWYAFNNPESWGTNMQTTMTIHPVTCKTVGITEHADPEASVHPNPAGGVVNITTWKSAGKIRLDILTLTGSIAYSRSFPGAITNFNIDFSHLSKGVYMLRLSDGNRQHTQKLILE